MQVAEGMAQPESLAVLLLQGESYKVTDLALIISR